MKSDIELIELEDNIEYLVSKKFEVNGSVYWYLVNKDDATDFCFRKVSIDNGKTVLIGLDDENEYNEVLFKLSEII